MLLPKEERENYKFFSGGEVDLGLGNGKRKNLNKLKIDQSSDIILNYQGQFPVIAISFKCSDNINSYEDVLS